MEGREIVDDDAVKEVCDLMTVVLTDGKPREEDVMELFNRLADLTLKKMKLVIKRTEIAVKNVDEDKHIVLQAMVNAVMKVVEKKIDPTKIDFSPETSRLRGTISPLKLLKRKSLEKIALNLGIEYTKIGNGILVRKIMSRLASEIETPLSRSVREGEAVRLEVSLMYLENVLKTCPIGWLPELIRAVIGWMKEDIYLFGCKDEHKILLKNRAQTLKNMCDKPRGKPSGRPSRVECLVQQNRFLEDVCGVDPADEEKNRANVAVIAIETIRNIQQKIDHHIASLSQVSEDSESFWVEEIFEKQAFRATLQLCERSACQKTSFCENSFNVMNKIMSCEATNPESYLFLRPPQSAALKRLRASMVGQESSTSRGEAFAERERTGEMELTPVPFDIEGEVIGDSSSEMSDDEETDTEEDNKNGVECCDRIAGPAPDKGLGALKEMTLQVQFTNDFFEFIAKSYLKDRKHLETTLNEVENDWKMMVRNGWDGGDVAHLLVLPTGCGKTGVAALIPYVVGLEHGARVLVIAPSTVICDVLETKVPQFLLEKGYVEKDRKPRVCVLFKSKGVEELDKYDLFVATYQSLHLKNILTLPRNSFDLIIVDEAHHEVSKSYRTVFQYFITSRKVFLTATPQRGDTLRVNARRVYSYPVAETIRNEYIKDIVLVEVGRNVLVCKKLYGETQRVPFDDVSLFNMKRPFVDLVQRSVSCQETVLLYSIDKLRELRQKSKKKHKMIVFVYPASEISEVERKLIQIVEHEDDLVVGSIVGGAPEEERRMLEKYDVIVNCRVLGEGYDNPEVSVVVLLSRDMSLLPFLQKIGRGVRWVAGWGKEEQVCHVIAHVGLNVRSLWEGYRRETVMEDVPKLVNDDPEFSEVYEAINPADADRFTERITPFLP
eukprot:TRINITY_DN30872_c0_g1_i12.p1 TRINITY_DN30872_c0_g1~~TRINITY_DN30872_c0_g1_i12.p1  ORF type:complete len:913 (+),score=229.08 TRINITY_DN30872_c0_g1_i12:66-2741(+)